MYDRWFDKPIPPKGVTLNFPMTPMLKQMFLYPSSDTTESFQPPE
jgi:glutamate/aspartate transport system substrate-binding protein